MEKTKGKKTSVAVLIPLLLLIMLTGTVMIVLKHEGLLDRWFRSKSPALEEAVFDEVVPYEPEALSENLLLVNKDHPLSEDYTPDITEYRDSGVLMNSCITEDYGKLSDHIRYDMNDRLYVMSSYRSFEEQQRVLEEEGSEVAARPGESEHMTGLALDVYAMYYAGSAFPQSPVGQYVLSHCQDYGFIIRYPEGKEDITGFEYEPWHIRYVGLPHSKLIMENDLTLEEYIDSIEPGKWYDSGDYLIGRFPEGEAVVPAQYSSSEITAGPDNTGCIIITVKK